MSCTQWVERLNDYIDGSSETSESLAVERHLLACSECREEADGLKSVLRGAASLPRRVDPGRDLWPGIAADLRRPLGRRLWPGAAAAVLILAAAAATSALWRTTLRAPGQPAEVADSGDVDGARELKEAEEEFKAASVKLMAALERRKSALPPRAIAELEENLRVVNEAISETSAALARDPENRRLGRLLTDIYATKLDLLFKAARLAGRA